MLDALEQLRENERLFRLLDHYAQFGGADPEAWQDRLMNLDGVDAKGLVQLHGQLLAEGWVEQNTGYTPELKYEEVPLCYRTTVLGRRVVRLALAARSANEDKDFEAA